MYKMKEPLKKRLLETNCKGFSHGNRINNKLLIPTMKSKNMHYVVPYNACAGQLFLLAIEIK